MTAFLFQRIRNNLMLYGFLLLGAVLAVAIFSSIPMYASGMLQRMLIKDMEIQQQDTGVHSGQLSVSRSYLKQSGQGDIPEAESKVMKSIYDPMTLPYVLASKAMDSNYFQLFTNNGDMINDHISFRTITDLSEHITIRSGRMPEPNQTNVEVLMTDQGLKDYDMVLGGTYKMTFAKKEVMTIEVVGLYLPSDSHDFYWGDGELKKMDSIITLLPDTFEALDQAYDQFYINSIIWKRFYDYRQLEIAQVPGVLETGLSQQKAIADLGDGFSLSYDLVETLESYVVRERILRITLWVLTVPVLIITAFYTYMISMLIIRNDENEIAMLKSRGAGTGQIFMMYVIQSGLMGLIAFIVGPWLGLLICRVIGASNGFLAFVNRGALPVEVTGEVLIFALVATIVFMIFMLTPAFRASRLSIVQYKRRKNQDISRTFWEKTYLDIVIILISGYGYYQFMGSGQLLSNTGQAGAQIDPLLFLVPTLFVLGFGLLSVRLYPYLLRFIYWIGKKQWRPVMYYSLLNASRAERTSKFISLFIVLFLSFGLLNASQARTLNQNAMDQVNYEYVADVRVQAYVAEREINEYWTDFLENFKAETDNSVIIADKVPYTAYENLPGVNGATKVFVNDDVFMKASLTNVDNLNMIGVVPHEFAQIAWMRDGLLPHHFVDYMNVMTQFPTAMFLSSDLAKDGQIAIGDSIELIWDKYSIIGVVYGFVDYFPGFNPYENDAEVPKNLVIANFDYMENRLPVQKYEIWLDKEEGVKDQDILNALAEAGLETERVTYREQALTQKSNDPMLQGTNGVLTMSYAIILLITLVGYLIFWVLNIRGRALKFGIFRAMGMGMRQVTAIIVVEQLLMIFGALSAGLAIGTAASIIFVPMLQKFDVASAQIPPFRVVILESDYANIILLTVLMLLLVLLILNNIVKRFKVNQVIKLGED